MSMVCFGLAEQLHAKEQEIRSIPVTDADSLCAYLNNASPWTVGALLCVMILPRTSARQ